jgi:hypothetical protein
MYIAINKTNHLEFHNFTWTEDNKLIVNGKQVNPEDWDIVEIISSPEFSPHNPERLRSFIRELNTLIDEYHPNIYLNDEIFEGVDMIIKAVNKQIKQ